MSETDMTPQPGLTFAIVGFGFGVIALCLVLLQFFAGPFAPQPSIGETIGEIAADIRTSAWTRLRGDEVVTTPEALPFTIDRLMIIGSMVLGVAAMALGAVGYVRHEPKRHITAAISFGVATVIFQFFATALFLILGLILLLGIISNLGDILDGFGG